MIWLRNKKKQFLNMHSNLEACQMRCVVTIEFDIKITNEHGVFRSILFLQGSSNKQRDFRYYVRVCTI